MQSAFCILGFPVYRTCIQSPVYITQTWVVSAPDIHRFFCCHYSLKMTTIYVAFTLYQVPVGFLQILCHLLYKGLEHPWILVSMAVFWNQSHVDTGPQTHCELGQRSHLAVAPDLSWKRVSLSSLPQWDNPLQSSAQVPQHSLLSPYRGGIAKLKHTLSEGRFQLCGILPVTQKLENRRALFWFKSQKNIASGVVQ